jgi:thiamine kinase-like enzyme
MEYIWSTKIEKENYFELLKYKLNLVKNNALRNKYSNNIKLKKLLNYFNKNSNAFDNEKISLIHNDLWYMNLLWNKNWFLSIIDFETSIYAPKQIELFKIYNHLNSAQNYYDDNAKEYKELDFLKKFISYLKINYKELFQYNEKQKKLYNIVLYFTILSKYNESWYNHDEVEKFWNGIKI